MKYAFISDIHANLPALSAVLEDLDVRKPDMTFCLGDLVGYAPWPNEVVGLIRSRNIPTIAGNYDEGVGLNSDDCGCAYKSEEDKRRGAESISFTNRIVTPVTRRYLLSLPRHMRMTVQPAPRSDGDMMDVLMVHGSPRRINEYLYEDRAPGSFLRMMEQAGTDVMLFGHTHKPFHKVLEYDLDGRPAFRHAINIGSVGKPKDGDPRACYVLLDIEERASRHDPESVRVECVRAEYDVEQAASAIEDSVLPDAFADMLRKAY